MMTSNHCFTTNDPQFSKKQILALNKYDVPNVCSFLGNQYIQSYAVIGFMLSMKECTYEAFTASSLTIKREKYFLKALKRH